MNKIIQKKQAVSLGILRLDYDYPPALGDIDCPETFGYDVFYKVVPGLTFEMCQSGEITEEVKENIKNSVIWLNNKNVSGITGDCGFMINIQNIVCLYTDKPVFLSALIQIPMIVHSYKSNERIAIFTANGKSLSKMNKLIYELCSVNTDDDKLIIVGCEDVPGFEAVALGEKVDTKLVEPNLVKKTQELIMEYPDIKCILMECTELPPYSDSIRQSTGLPVYDSITCADFYINGFKDNPRFGLNNWQDEWDEEQEKYVYGSNLTNEERDKLINKSSSEKIEDWHMVGNLPFAELEKEATELEKETEDIYHLPYKKR